MNITGISAGWKKVTESNGVVAIRQGLVQLIPVLLIGAFALVLKSLPVNVYLSFINNFANGIIYTLFDTVYNITFGLLSVFMAASIAYSYAVLLKNNNNHTHLGTIITAISCFILLTGVNNLSTDTLGPKGMFLAIIATLGASKLYAHIYKLVRPINIMTDGADIRLSTAVRSVVPMVITISVFVAVNQTILIISGKSSIHALMLDGAKSLFAITGTGILSGFVFVLISSILWFFGIHGSDVLEGVSSSVYTPATNVNIALAAAGDAPTQILTKPFFDVFVLMGGCGSTICLLFALLLFSKRRSNRGLAKIAAFPMIFNINEIMVFGLPIIYNPTMLMPFLGVPLMCFFTTYAAMAFGLVPLVTSAVEWTTPVLLGGYLATGSVAGIILQIVNIILGVIIYRPFVLKYDREKLENIQMDYEKLVGVMKDSEVQCRPIRLTKLYGSNGSLAKALAADLHKALEKGELKLFYQPQYRADGSCLGAEALLRWNHSLIGMVYPPLMLKLASEIGFLDELERFIILRAIEDANKLYEINAKKIKISVNVTGISIQEQGFEEFLVQSAEKINAGVCICLELTEQTALKFDDVLKNRLERLHKCGYMLAVDDFSMGNTSLKYLQDTHFDMVKLDGTLVKEALSNPRCLDIISSIIILSKKLGFAVLAEYVSSEEIRDNLLKVGCTLYQGWLYSPAVTFEALVELLSKT